MPSKVPTAEGRVEGNAKMDDLVSDAIASGANAVVLAQWLQMLLKAGTGSSRAVPAGAHSMSRIDVGTVLMPMAPVSSVEKVRLRRGAG